MCLAIPGRVASVTGEGLTRLARVDFGGIVKEVNLALLPEAAVGDYVLVHVGIALARIDEREANRVFEYLKQIDDLADLEGG